MTPSISDLLPQENLRNRNVIMWTRYATKKSKREREKVDEVGGEKSFSLLTFTDNFSWG